MYGHIDVALDPFPHNGGTTTLDAMWMGVPVITLAGNTSRSRIGVSLLSAVGLENFIASSPAEYIQIAKDLVFDSRALVTIRKGLRRQLLCSSLCDEPAYTRKLEEAFRTMWRRSIEFANASALSIQSEISSKSPGSPDQSIEGSL